MTLHHVLDTAVIVVCALATAGSTLIIGSAETTEQLAELRLLLLPFLGALVMSGGIIMLNPQPETRRIVIGRSIIALFCGVLGPQLIGLIHPSLAAVSVKPIVEIALGGIIAGLAYIISKPFFGELYKRADNIAKTQVDRLQERYVPSKAETNPPPQD